MKLACIVVLFFCAQGCGPTGKPATPDPTPVVKIDAGPVQADAADQALSEAECEELFNHTLEVVFTSRQRELPAEQRPTDEDLRAAKQSLRAELIPSCVGATREDFPFECAMAATSKTEMAACVGAK